jgi:hypothetical protein
MPTYRVDITINGRPTSLLVDGQDEAAARAQLNADFESGGISEYPTPAGTVIAIRWHTVSTYETPTFSPA